jgi:hypothetical protein
LPRYVGSVSPGFVIKGKAVAAFAIAMFAAIPQPFASDLAGQASVIDGETLEIRRTRIRYGESLRPTPIGFAGPKGLTSLQIETKLPLQIGAAVANVTTPAQAGDAR